MGSAPSTPDQKPTPPEPETVKRTEAEIAKARNSAKTAAAKKYGVSGTNVTRGRVTDETLNTKQKKLGGD